MQYVDARLEDAATTNHSDKLLVGPQRRQHIQTEYLSKRSKLKGCLQILARGLVGLVALIVVLAVVGYAYEHYVSKRDMKRYPPPGQLRQVENHTWAVPIYNSHPGSYESVFQHKFLHTMYAEAQAMETSNAQVAAVGSMGDTPLIVIRLGKPMPSGTEETEQKRQAFQEEIAGKSSAGRIVVAEASGHGIQGEQPANIVEAVQQLLKSPLVETVNGQLTQQFNEEVKQHE